MNNAKNMNHNTGLKTYSLIKLIAMAMFLTAQFMIIPTLASQSSLSGSISYSGAQLPTITMTVQNYTDYLGHSDILQASTSYSGDQIDVIVNGHLSHFSTGTTTFNLDVLPMGTYSITACDKQASSCSNPISVRIIGTPAVSTQQNQNPASGTTATQHVQTSQASNTSTTPNQQSSNSSTVTSASSLSSSAKYTSPGTQTANSTVSTGNVLASNINTNSSNSTSKTSGNTTTASLSGGVSVTSILPVLLGIAIAVALGYTLISNRRRKAGAAV